MFMLPSKKTPGAGKPSPAVSGREGCPFRFTRGAPFTPAHAPFSGLNTQGQSRIGQGGDIYLDKGSGLGGGHRCRAFLREHLSGDRFQPETKLFDRTAD